MRLGTRQECVGSSPRVSRVCQNSVREFVKRRPRLAKRLSGLGIEPSSDDAVGSRWKFTRRFAEGIGKLAGTRREIAGKKTGGLTARLSEITGVYGS
ncbi:hypothetical protein GW17_00056433 [Ensete ventricosum]|nr:hypothetical protein GW17_00056433 [Ensete ventricosum]